MVNFNDGGAAFPGAGNGGMSLRDYFAAQALQGTLSGDLTAWLKMHPDNFDTTTKLAEFSYRMADAMLAARKEQK